MLRAFQDRLRAEDDYDDDVKMLFNGKGVHFLFCSLCKDVGFNTLDITFSFFPLFSTILDNT